MITKKTDAEFLVDVANLILHPREDLQIYTTDMPYEMPAGYRLACDDPSVTVEVIALAIRFRSNPGLVFRALVERWDRFRIVRELY